MAPPAAPMQTSPAPREVFCAVRHVSKSFGVVRALHDVSFDIRAGEVLALIGENGAGKSTLMRVLEGEHRPDSGDIAIDGRPASFAAPADAHAAGIRLIHQEPEIIPELSVAENVFIGDYRSRAGVLLDWPDLERRTRRLLGQFGLQEVLSPRRPCRRLGPAQRQLIEIMRALRPGVRLLALDEPTSSLTEEEAQRLFGIVRQLRRDGVAIVYISHRLREITSLADRIAVLRDGELVAERAAGATNETELVQLMVGRPLGAVFNHATRTRPEPILEASGVTTRHVTDISFTLHRGEILGVAGLIGAGRSELARGLFGFDRLTAGRVAVAGRPIRLRSPADAILAGIGFVPEDRKQEALLLMRGVRDNISLCIPHRISRLGFVRRGAETAVVRPIVERLRIKTPTLSQPVAKLSGGNQQKVVFGRWLAREPRILILDEPTRGIDVGAKAEIYQLVEQLAAAGVAILLISSEMPELLGLTDRILVMHGGRVTGIVPTAAATEQVLLDLAMADNITRREQAS